MVPFDRDLMIRFRNSLASSGLYLTPEQRWEYVTRSLEAYDSNLLGMAGDPRGEFRYSESPGMWALSLCHFSERRERADGQKRPLFYFATGALSDARTALESPPLHLRKADLKALEAASVAVLDHYGK
ncbi:MAG: hypothetical protein V1820_06740 [archaeon]